MSPARTPVKSKGSRPAPVRDGKDGHAALGPTLSASELERVLERIREARNFDFRNYKRATLRRRIERRMHERLARNAAEYIKVLERDPVEYETLLSTMLIKVTSFFRDPEVWEAVAKKALPQLLAEKAPGEELRVWCAGCATGEEAFSVAIQIAQALGPAFGQRELKVFGTDADEKAIAFARRGIYRREQAESIPPKILRDYFVEENGGLAVRKEIRRCVVFGINNLVSDAPISRLDMLWCRNVFIYLDAELQKRVLARFHYGLRKNGVLVLGKSELIPFAAKVFDPIDISRRIYRKDGRGRESLQQERLAGVLQADGVPARPQADIEAEQFHRDVLHSLRLPMIGTTNEGLVTLWNPAAADLWGRREAEVLGKRLASLSLPGLSGELLIEKTLAVREGATASEKALGQIERHGHQPPIQFEVEVAPLRAGKRISGILYLVHDISAFREVESRLAKANEERRSALEELQTINEEMQSSNEELETTNEELQSANEELQTTNEELQSTNEELETTNEELQSTNAELDATNRELATRTDDLNKLGFCQRVIIRSVPSAVVVLEPGGRITLSNLAAERFLGLTEGEAVGQSLWSLRVPAFTKPMLQRLKKALSQKQAIRKERIRYELPLGGEGHAELSAIPIVDDGTSLGSVIIFEDVTRAQQGKPRS